jgi:hypothetical protein
MSWPRALWKAPAETGASWSALRGLPSRLTAGNARLPGRTVLIEMAGRIQHHIVADRLDARPEFLEGFRLAIITDSGRHQAGQALQLVLGRL